MNKIKKEILKELRKISRKLEHSPGRREVPNLSRKCYKHFGSFNKAKELLGLEIKNKRITLFPKKVFKKDKDLAKIAAYLTTDGHLYKDLSGFIYFSKNVEDLQEFERLIKRKFGLRGKYHLNSGRGGITHSFYVFNKKICKELFKLGIPKGDKIIQRFHIPKWIYSSKAFSKEYLKIAFFCEGSNKEESGRTPRIQINIAKSEELLESGLEFMNTLRKMLKNLGINTTRCYIAGKRLRKRDNKISRDIKFRIDIKDNDKFIKEIAPFFRWG